MEDHKKVPSTQILIEVKVEVVKPHFDIDMKACIMDIMDIINMRVNFMEVDKETLKDEEVIEVMVEVIEVNNQIATQTTIIVKNMGTWQRIVIKRSMMHEMEKLQQGNYASTNNQGYE
jgi:hypothetical protein